MIDDGEERADVARAQDQAAAQDEARAAQERQSQVRHDLRAPLAVMYPLLSLMQAADGLDDRQMEQLGTLERQVQRLDRMIAGVADSGWFDCCGSPTVVQDVSVGDLVKEIVDAARLSGDDVTLSVQLDQATPPARADATHVRQILADLVDNARRYGPPAGPVGIALRPGEAPQTVALVVSDRGPGIPPGELPLVTGFGYRGAIAQGVPGLGLGLWVCRRLAERMGGEIGIESTPGSGTRVRLVLPAAW